MQNYDENDLCKNKIGKSQKKKGETYHQVGQ
jgi:hypothetical protein